MNEFQKIYSDGLTVYVTDHMVGFVGGHPSNVDYYRESRGYDCGSDNEKVADQYHANFADLHLASTTASPGSREAGQEVDTMTETPLDLLREIRDGLAPALAGLSEDDPAEALEWVWEELRVYSERIVRALREEVPDDSDADPT